MEKEHQHTISSVWKQEQTSVCKQVYANMSGRILIHLPLGSASRHWHGLTEVLWVIESGWKVHLGAKLDHDAQGPTHSVCPQVHVCNLQWKERLWADITAPESSAWRSRIMIMHTCICDTWTRFSNYILHTVFSNYKSFEDRDLAHSHMHPQKQNWTVSRFSAELSSIKKHYKNHIS